MADAPPSSGLPASASGDSESASNAAPKPQTSTPPKAEMARPAATAGKPRFALFIATACGLGCIPVAPGTFGALAGVFLVALPLWTVLAVSLVGDMHVNLGAKFDPVVFLHILFGIVTATIGVWAATRAAQFWSQNDPQRVVIDEVSGQQLAILLGCAIPVWWKPAMAAQGSPIALLNFHTAISWKYLLVGFILFRAFDIWKPFPARQAESLSGGWGIMADDWVAGIYAAIGLWIARAAGL
jgi:phosphatidylglycerophosphatase A